MCDKCKEGCDPYKRDRHGRVTTEHRTVRFNPAQHGRFPILERRSLVYRHTCFNKFCSNKEHLVISENRENLLDEDVNRTGTLTHCVNGHEMTEENMRISKPCKTHDAQRFCRTCQRIWMQEYRSKKKGATTKL